jgi:hypothetical protein
MYARRKVCQIASCRDDRLRDSIGRVAASENERLAMDKDCHLIEAALACDRTVISLDEARRRGFARAADSVAQLTTIVWVNPDRDDEEAIVWLEAGALPERKRQLGHIAGRGAR